MEKLTATAKNVENFQNNQTNDGLKGIPKLNTFTVEHELCIIRKENCRKLVVATST